MQKNYQYILWDLDGTLTDPMVGITKSVQYALQCQGIVQEDLRELCSFIGPPLADTFRELYHFSELQIREAVRKYRERFSIVGWRENVVYPGIPELLKQLCENGKCMMVATSKPEEFARQILEYFQLADYFTFIGGATLDGVRSRKEEVIAYVLDANGISCLSEAVMIGDRKYDIYGGRQCGLDTIGVGYGYGSLQELEEAGADAVVETIADLKHLLLLKKEKQLRK